MTFHGNDPAQSNILGHFLGSLVITIPPTIIIEKVKKGTRDASTLSVY